MAKPCTRTPADDVSDALALLDAAAKELANWRAHLVAARDGDCPIPHHLNAQNSAMITYDAVASATALTHQATTRHAGPALRCVR